jgi:hypothetical protein
MTTELAVAAHANAIGAPCSQWPNTVLMRVRLRRDLRAYRSANYYNIFLKEIQKLRAWLHRRTVSPCGEDACCHRTLPQSYLWATNKHPCQCLRKHGQLLSCLTNVHIHSNWIFSVRFEDSTAVIMKNAVFWYVMLCGSCKNHTAQHPRRRHSLNLFFLKNIKHYSSATQFNGLQRWDHIIVFQKVKHMFSSKRNLHSIVHVGIQCIHEYASGLERTKGRTETVRFWHSRASRQEICPGSAVQSWHHDPFSWQWQHNGHYAVNYNHTGPNIQQVRQWPCFVSGTMTSVLRKSSLSEDLCQQLCPLQNAAKYNSPGLGWKAASALPQSWG